MLEEVLEEIRIKLQSLSPIIVIIWIAINVIASLNTIFLYSWQYPYYPVYLWIFIPDCATFGILFGIFLYMTLIMHRNNQVVNIVTFIGIVKVFVASFMVFVYNPFYFDIFSLVGHLGLLIEAFLILPFVKPSFQDIMISTGIHSIDWFFDFFNPLSEYPTLFLYNEPNHPTAAFFLELFVIITLISILTILFIIIFKKYTLELTSKTRETIKTD
ncbi:MAG: DUF1405 domain-containing protein [Candidatus Thorarchaeota archaeon]